MHYYQHHIGDFLRDTSHLSNDQMAVYLKMLWRYYDTEKPLPDDCEGIAFAVRSDEKTVGLLLRHFFQLAEDGWHHKRCDSEISEYRQKSDKARTSANARWRNANAMRTHTEGNADEPKNDANQEPITNNQETTPKPPRGAVRVVELPAGLDGEAWSRWVAYRAEIKKPIKSVSELAAMKAMAKLGGRQGEAVEHSIAMGWTGLFAPDKPASSGRSAKPEMTRDQIFAGAI